MDLEEVIKRQFNYCNAIAEDILANGKTKEVQEYAQQFAEIESSNTEGIRIHFGDVYVFLFEDRTFRYLLNGLGEYDAEIIDTKSISGFMNELEKITDEEILAHSYMESDDGDYSQYAPKEYIAFPN